jgi:hypothetical protein
VIELVIIMISNNHRVITTCLAPSKHIRYTNSVNSSPSLWERDTASISLLGDEKRRMGFIHFSKVTAYKQNKSSTTVHTQKQDQKWSLLPFLKVKS